MSKLESPIQCYYRCSQHLILCDGTIDHTGLHQCKLGCRW